MSSHINRTNLLIHRYILDLQIVTAREKACCECTLKHLRKDN